MKRWLLTLFIGAIHECCPADAFIIAPTPPPGPGPGPAYTATFFPFFLQQIQLNSMRYQQVYNASVFTNVAPECIYITTLTFIQSFNQQGTTKLTITNMQINLSTTQSGADNLSTNFADNVGSDDTIVFGPGRHDFDDTMGGGRFLILLDQPFRYNPSSGNLLLDVRIFNGAGPVVTNPLASPALQAFNSLTDESSRVWATNVTDSVASGVDTMGLDTVIQFSAVPSLQIQVESVFGTNRQVVRWPAQPSVFVPQTSPQVGSNAVWQTITNGILGSPDGPDRAIYLPVPPLGTSGFYRRLWESGKPAQPVAISVLPEARRESPQIK
ncbi:MAG TPA: hypothetical protein VN887_10595 [Candidatus Angelobacter sp.]|nr:hypothetical protein [Candidatus Angelobacter sp.]